jgi:hypothetical protein
MRNLSLRTEYQGPGVNTMGCYLPGVYPSGAFREFLIRVCH